jgi:hypothetical protein
VALPNSRKLTNKIYGYWQNKGKEIAQQNFEECKGVIRSCKSKKDKQYNG